MKAIICPRYGSPDVLELRELPKPTPKPGEALIKIHATGLNAADWRIVRADPFLVRLAMGPFKPNIKGKVSGKVSGMTYDFSHPAPT